MPRHRRERLRSAELVPNVAAHGVIGQLLVSRGVPLHEPSSKQRVSWRWTSCRGGPPKPVQATGRATGAGEGRQAEPHRRCRERARQGRAAAERGGRSVLALVEHEVLYVTISEHLGGRHGEFRLVNFLGEATSRSTMEHCVALLALLGQ